MKHVQVLFAIALVVLQVNAQFFGNVNRLPFGGQRETIGFKAGPTWGSLSQDRNRFGFTGPKTIGGGADLLTPKGTGVSGSIFHQPGVGGQGTLRAQANVFSTPNHNLNAWAQHDRFLDKNLKPFGPETNSAGLNYNNKNGFDAFGSVSKTNGQRTVNTVGAGVPLFTSKDGNTKLRAEGSSSFGHGMKPNHNVGLTLESKF